MESASSHSAAANGAPLSVVVPSPEYQELDLNGAKQLAASIPDLKPQSLGHLLIELSLAEELTAWRIEEKPERLLALAKRCKVNVDKIRASVEAELKKGPAEKKLEELGLLPKMQTAAKTAGGAK
jgi:hypothetical protein